MFSLSAETIIKLVRDAQQCGCKSITFSGGEFFVHPDSYRILDYTLRHTDFDVSVATNGTCIRLAELMNLPTDRLTFSVSIDGFQADHDSRRGVGCYAKSISNSQLLRETGFRVGASITLDAKNVTYLPALVDYLLEVFDTVTFICIGKTGAACDHAVELGLESDSLVNTVRLIYRTLSDANSARRCRIFPFSVSVKYDGTVYPCRLARDMDILDMGSILESSLQDVMKSFARSAAGQELLAYENNDSIPECGQCPSNAICWHGCRIRAKKWSNKLLAPDPFACALYLDKHDVSGLSDLFWGNR